MQGRYWNKWALPASFGIYPEPAPICPRDSSGSEKTSTIDAIRQILVPLEAHWKEMWHWRCHSISSIPAPEVKWRHWESTTSCLPIYLSSLHRRITFWIDAWSSRTSPDSCTGRIRHATFCRINIGLLAVERRVWHCSAMVLSPNCHIVCYTDDTLMVEMSSWGRAVANGSIVT